MVGPLYQPLLWDIYSTLYTSNTKTILKQDDMKKGDIQDVPWHPLKNTHEINMFGNWNKITSVILSSVKFNITNTLWSKTNLNKDRSVDSLTVSCIDFANAKQIYAAQKKCILSLWVNSRHFELCIASGYSIPYRGYCTQVFAFIDNYIVKIRKNIWFI
jgi:hypothetical protein